MKLFRSKAAIDQIQFGLKQMQEKKSWRTSISGILVGVCLLAKIWAPSEYQTKINDTRDAFIMIGLIAAADNAAARKKEQL